MTAASFFRLLCLAAIWGGSFLFMRVAANTFGPAYLIEFRVAFAAIALLLIAFYLKRNLPSQNTLSTFSLLACLIAPCPFCFLLMLLKR